METHNRSASNVEDCPICLQPMVPAETPLTNATQTALVKLRPCGHEYHRSCVQELVSTARSDLRCPVCRIKIGYNRGRPGFRIRPARVARSAALIGIGISIAGVTSGILATVLDAYILRSRTLYADKSAISEDESLSPSWESAFRESLNYLAFNIAICTSLAAFTFVVIAFCCRAGNQQGEARGAHHIVEQPNQATDQSRIEGGDVEDGDVEMAALSSEVTPQITSNQLTLR